MLTIPFAVYLIGLALVLHGVFRRAGEDDGSSAGRLAKADVGLECRLSGVERSYWLTPRNVRV